ncbi:MULTISPECIES: hypothetical protein [unclassified Mesorhizobium]|uniref:hypothetical protein n=1 Tax=unclassified Mesorhizobium TaxID=325217 RepID=UPI000FCB80CC|nr:MULTISPECIES: hypothetical protein [unclassified Mesorhizobium]RVD31637.1 hypothetical protein EN738_01060 [Mesorhizobium sp. M4B.F.Ca.ET.017.02.2.1]RWA59110.1 MAG: hypothetical protein EOQ27_26835 [Mesorhizobium sp.]
MAGGSSGISGLPYTGFGCSPIGRDSRRGGGFCADAVRILLCASTGRSEENGRKYLRDIVMSRAARLAGFLSMVVLVATIVIHVLFREIAVRYINHMHAEYLVFVLILIFVSGIGFTVWYLLYRPTPLLAAKIAMTFFAVSTPISAFWPFTIDFLIRFDPNSIVLQAGNPSETTSSWSTVGLLASLFGFAYFAQLYINLGRPQNRIWADQEW